MSTTPVDPRPQDPSFAETALKLGGKSEDEARRTGAIDKADDQVEALFAKQYQTTASPAHRAVWDDTGVPLELFSFDADEPSAAAAKVMDDSLSVVRRHRRDGTLHDANGKIRDEVLNELAAAGYWGLLVDQQYGGSGVPFSAFAPFLTRMATIDPTIAGMASVHGCIGAVDPVRTFGSDEQKRRYLPELASGRKLSGFALTEPAAGSDLTALRTRAVRDGDEFVVNGEKLFITNVVPGRTVGLVCLIDDKPAVLVVDLPAEENEHFQLKKYGLYALKHTYNQGIVFRDFRVPAANLLQPTRGDGLTIAYHGLNLGRTALCATAAGSMRIMLAEMLPWAKFRRTYGAAIETRELVRRRIGRLAGLIVTADALTAWCASLIDHGFRGEMECVIAKIFGSEMQKEAAIELLMKTHGGRSFLHGHLFGDNVHEFLAPCIYEGEGEMLGMAFFKSLVKQHGVEFFEPIGKTLVASGIKKPNLSNPAHLWALRKPMAKYAKWMVGKKLHHRPTPKYPSLPGPLRRHAEFAVEFLNGAALDVSGTMRKHQLALADRQCRMSELSARIQTAIVILCTSLYAARQNDELIEAAADCVCNDFRRQLTGKRASDRDFRAVTKLGEAVAAGGFTPLVGIEPAHPILMPYEQ
jgi:alkylation response protein AidB-like acyl-CoA dehydrogenase